MNILNTINIYNLQTNKCMESTVSQNGLEEENTKAEKALLEKTCILILGGGQSTRLGTEKPKGVFKIDSLDGNPKNKTTLFIRHFNKIKAINEKYGITMKVIILCSDHTLSETENYIKKIYNEEVEYIKQKNEDCVDFDNNRLFKNKDEVQTSPNGNGGVFEALETYKMFDKFKEWGIEVLNVIGVDNAMANLLDVNVLIKFYSPPDINPPLIMRNPRKLKYDIISKGVIRKLDEQAGIFEISDNKLIVKEYSEFSEEYKKSIKSDALINICHHYFSVEFLRKNRSKFSLLKFHEAEKKIPYFDFKRNELVTPEKANGKKFEKFIFDIFEFTDATRNITHKVSRDEFLPLKNLTGNDSVETVTEGLSKEQKKDLKKEIID